MVWAESGWRGVPHHWKKERKNKLGKRVLPSVKGPPAWRRSTPRVLSQHFSQRRLTGAILVTHTEHNGPQPHEVADANSKRQRKRLSGQFWRRPDLNNTTSLSVHDSLTL